MSRTSTNPVRHALNGPTMGTRWSALSSRTGASTPRPCAPRAADRRRRGGRADVHMEPCERPHGPQRVPGRPLGEGARSTGRGVAARARDRARFGRRVRHRHGRRGFGMGLRTQSGRSGRHSCGDDATAPAGARSDRAEGRRRASVPRSRSTSTASPRATGSTGWPKRSSPTGSTPVSSGSTARCARSVFAQTEKPGQSRWRRRTLPTGRPIPSSRFTTLPSRPRATIATGSRCKTVACRTRWTRSAARRSSPPLHR